MKKVFLHGSISEGVGAEWDLMVDSPSEAIRAINCNTDSRFLQNLTDSHLRGEGVVILKVNEEFRELSKTINESEEFDASLFEDFLVKSSHEIDIQSDFDELHIIPKVDGEIVMATTAIGAMGAALASVSWATVAFSMVAGMVVSGIAAAMFPPVKTNDQTKRTKSYMFGSRDNIMEQGGPVPVGYGQLKIGSSTLCFFGQSRFLPGSVGNDTLESYTQYHIQDMISEGPIAGFCDISGNILNHQNAAGVNWDNNKLVKSIYVNDMPIKNASNQMNLIPAEDNPIRVPIFSLGSSNPSVPQRGVNGETLRNPPNSRVEYETRGTGSALPGPEFNISGFYPEFHSTSDKGKLRWGNAKAFTQSVSDRNTGLVTLSISSEGQYHNWTDQRVRRRFFSRRVTVDKGTDAVTMAVAVRMFDGKKFVPPILASSKNVLEGVDFAGAAASGLPQTSNYFISNILTSSDARAKNSMPPPSEGDLFRFFVYVLFEDSRLIGQVDIDKYNLAGQGYTNRDLLFLFINEAQDLVSFFCSSMKYSYSTANNPPLFSNHTATAAYTMNGSDTVDDIFNIYFNQNQRFLGEQLNQEKNPSLSSISVLLAGISSEFNSGYGANDIFLRFFHEVMTFVKNNVVDHDLTLGSDGVIYSTNKKVYYKTADRVKKLSITSAEKASGLWHYTPPVMSLWEANYYDDDEDEDEYWMVVNANKTISERRYQRLSSSDPGDGSDWRGSYQLFHKSGRIKNQGVINLKAITTSPASIDYSFIIPYIGPGEAVSIQTLRTTAEVTDINEMSTTSKRMSLKTIRRHKTIAGKLMRFEYPNTAWIQTFWDSVNFQQSPARNYLVKLKKVPVPQNYHPETRSYIGAWNGLFKGEEPVSADVYDNYTPEGLTPRKALRKLNIRETHLEWTDNPAWILLDIMMNQRFGIGRFGMQLSDIDIWHLYAAAKFCDELVETGLPLETPKRYFETFNYSTKTKAQNKYLGSKSEYMQQDSFFLRIWSSKNKEPLPRGAFLDEYNDSVGDTESSSGKFIAFFMSDGSIERRKIQRVFGITSEQQVPGIPEEVDAGAQYIELCGPTFMNSSATESSSGKTTGFCCMEKSHPLVEPRFSLNVYYNRQQRALETVRELVSQFKTVLNYVGGKISFSTEKKTEPLMMFTDANVSVDGFGYAGVGRSTRVTAAKIRYLDKFDDYKSKIEYYEDPGGIDKFGYIEEEVVALGCTSRGQAQRYAKFTVVAPTLETELVTFTTGMEGALLLPGSIIEVSDSRRFGENINGRVKGVSADDYTVRVDKIMSNLSFWNPQTGLDDDRVELCIVTPSGFEDSSELTLKNQNLAGTANFSDDDQLALIADVRKSQMVYFDGNISSSNKREINRIQKKERFEVNKNSDSIVKNNHGLSSGDLLRFTSFGVLPKYAYEEFDQANNATGNIIEERLSEDLSYYVVGVEKTGASVSSFKISKTRGGNPVDFIDKGFAMRKTFNSAASVDEGAEISGGEHFYKVEVRADGRDDTRQALADIMVGSVWSIRGFKKDIILRPDSVSDEIREGFILHSTGLDSYQVKGKRNSYYSKKIGPFMFSGQASLADSSAGTVISIKQRGLGAVLINTTHFASTSHIDLVSSLREVKLIDGYNIVVTEDGLATTLYRSSLDTDLFKVVGSSQAGVTTPGAQNALYLTIRNKTYLVREEDGDFYIKLDGVKPTKSLVSSWVDNLTTAENEITDIQGPTSPPADTIEISIDDFRNVGRRQYRINSVIENGYGTYEVKGSEYNREKFSIIENEISLNRPTLPIPPQVSMEIPLPPKGFKVKDTTYRGLVNV